MGVVVAVISLFVAYFAWWQPQWKQRADSELSHSIDDQIDAKLKSPLAQLSDQGRILARIEGRTEAITDLLKIVVQNEIRRAASLPMEEFKRSLLDLKTALSVARGEHVSASAEAVASIKSKLIKIDQDTPGFWGAAAAVISYQSPERVGDLPDCLLADPVGKDWSVRGNVVTHGPLVYSNCSIALNDPRAVDILARTLTIANLMLKRCVVIYKGNPIILPPLPPPRDRVIGSIIFDDCTFDISTRGTPLAVGRELLTALLNARDPRSITFTPNGA